MKARGLSIEYWVYSVRMYLFDEEHVLASVRAASECVDD